MKRIVLIVLISIAAIVALNVFIYSPYLFRSEAGIRESLLSQTPIGTNSTEVRAYVDGHGWLVRNYVGHTGFLKQEFGKKKDEVVGVTSIQGNIGDYGPMNITAFWGFDSKNQLIDIWVWRTFDAP